MIMESDLRLKELKKKIFFDQPLRQRGQDRNNKDSDPKLPQGDMSRSASIVQQLRKQVEQMQTSNNELKRLLREERERYDRLFEEYEQLAQKNSVIEKEYINLKYEHNREIKELKKAISNTIKEKVGKAEGQFQVALKQQKIADSLRNKIDKFVQNMHQLSQITQKFRLKKTSKQDSQIQPVSEQKPKDILLVARSTVQQTKIDFFELQSPTFNKVTSSPEKEKSLKTVKSQKDISCKQQPLVFLDEYYGTIEDFPSYEQKIMVRRNYQLMRRNSRGSNEVKRKKIFEQS